VSTLSGVEVPCSSIASPPRRWAKGSEVRSYASLCLPVLIDRHTCVRARVRSGGASRGYTDDTEGLEQEAVSLLCECAAMFYPVRQGEASSVHTHVGGQHSGFAEDTASRPGGWDDGGGGEGGGGLAVLGERLYDALCATLDARRGVGAGGGGPRRILSCAAAVIRPNLGGGGAQWILARSPTVVRQTVSPRSTDKHAPQPAQLTTAPRSIDRPAQGSQVAALLCGVETAAGDGHGLLGRGGRVGAPALWLGASPPATEALLQTLAAAPFGALQLSLYRCLCAHSCSGEEAAHAGGAAGAAFLGGSRSPAHGTYPQSGRRSRVLAQ
jgi:hypothetical protein